MEFMECPTGGDIPDTDPTDRPYRQVAVYPES